MTEYPTGITEVGTVGGGAVMSYFTNNGKQYVAFVNRSCTESIMLSIGFDAEAEAAFVAKDGTESEVAHEYTIEPGDIRICTWK